MYINRKRDFIRSFFERILEVLQAKHCNEDLILSIKIPYFYQPVSELQFWSFFVSILEDDSKI